MLELTPSPPRPQNLFWDLLDPVAAAPYSAHAFQRQQLPEIERRCAQLRVRAVAQVVGKPVESLEHGVARAIGHCTERGFEIQLVRIPRHGVPWGACCRQRAIAMVRMLPDHRLRPCTQTLQWQTSRCSTVNSMSDTQHMCCI